MKYNWFSKPVFVTLATSITLLIRFYLHFLIARPYVASKISTRNFRVAKIENLPCVIATRRRNGNEGRRNRHDVTARMKAIEINDVKLLSRMFLAGVSTVSIGEFEDEMKAKLAYLYSDDGCFLKLETFAYKVNFFYFTYRKIQYEYLSYICKPYYSFPSKPESSDQTIPYRKICEKGDS